VDHAVTLEGGGVAVLADHHGCLGPGPQRPQPLLVPSAGRPECAVSVDVSDDDAYRIPLARRPGEHALTAVTHQRPQLPGIQRHRLVIDVLGRERNRPIGLSRHGAPPSIGVEAFCHYVERAMLRSTLNGHAP